MRRQSGFSLIELMVVVAVIGILAAIVYPSYTSYVLRSNRADGREMLMRVAAAQERFYTNRNAYAAALSGSGGLGFASGDSTKGYYTVSIELGANDQSYVLTAAPNKRQTEDKCGSLVLNNTGAKSFSGNENNGSCW